MATREPNQGFSPSDWSDVELSDYRLAVAYALLTVIAAPAFATAIMYLAEWSS
jgi:hypothetical protein